MYRVMKEEKLDLSEGILRKLTLKSLTSFFRFETLAKPIFGQIDFLINFISLFASKDLFGVLAEPSPLMQFEPHQVLILCTIFTSSSNFVG